MANYTSKFLGPEMDEAFAAAHTHANKEALDLYAGLPRIDSAPTTGSNNPVSSGGVAAALSGYISTVQDLIAQSKLPYLTADQVRALLAQNTADDLTEDQVAEIVAAAIQAAGSNVITTAQLNTKLDGYTPIETHIAHEKKDSTRWQQQSDIEAKMIAMMYRIAQEVYAGTTPQYDYSNPMLVFGNGGLLTLGGGQSWDAPSNGKIVVLYNAILGVAPILKVNDDTIDYGGVSVLGSGDPYDHRVNAGDSITATGSLSLGSSFNVTFYPNK